MCGKERRGYTLTCLLCLRVLKVPAHARSFIGAVRNISLSMELQARSMSMSTSMSMSMSRSEACGGACSDGSGEV